MNSVGVWRAPKGSAGPCARLFSAADVEAPFSSPGPQLLSIALCATGLIQLRSTAALSPSVRPSGGDRSGAASGDAAFASLHAQHSHPAPWLLQPPQPLQQDASSRTWLLGTAHAHSLRVRTSVPAAPFATHQACASAGGPCSPAPPSSNRRRSTAYGAASAAGSGAPLPQLQQQRTRSDYGFVVAGAGVGGAAAGSISGAAAAFAAALAAVAASGEGSVGNVASPISAAANLRHALQSVACPSVGLRHTGGVPAGTVGGVCPHGGGRPGSSTGHLPPPPPPPPPPAAVAVVAGAAPPQYQSSRFHAGAGGRGDSSTPTSATAAAAAAAAGPQLTPPPPPSASQLRGTPSRSRVQPPQQPQLMTSSNQGGGCGAIAAAGVGGRVGLAQLQALSFRAPAPPAGTGAAAAGGGGGGILHAGYHTFTWDKDATVRAAAAAAASAAADAIARASRIAAEAKLEARAAAAVAAADNAAAGLPASSPKAEAPPEVVSAAQGDQACTADNSAPAAVVFGRDSSNAAAARRPAAATASIAAAAVPPPAVIVAPAGTVGGRNLSTAAAAAPGPTLLQLLQAASASLDGTRCSISHEAAAGGSPRAGAVAAAAGGRRGVRPPAESLLETGDADDLVGFVESWLGQEATSGGGGHDASSPGGEQRDHQQQRQQQQQQQQQPDMGDQGDDPVVFYSHMLNSDPTADNYCFQQAAAGDARDAEVEGQQQVVQEPAAMTGQGHEAAAKEAAGNSAASSSTAAAVGSGAAALGSAAGGGGASQCSLMFSTAEAAVATSSLMLTSQNGAPGGAAATGSALPAGVETLTTSTDAFGLLDAGAAALASSSLFEALAATKLHRRPATAAASAAGAAGAAKAPSQQRALLHPAAAGTELQQQGLKTVSVALGSPAAALPLLAAPADGPGPAGHVGRTTTAALLVSSSSQQALHEGAGGGGTHLSAAGGQQQPALSSHQQPSAAASHAQKPPLPYGSAAAGHALQEQRTGPPSEVKRAPPSPLVLKLPPTGSTASARAAGHSPFGAPHGGTSGAAAPALGLNSLPCSPPPFHLRTNNVHGHSPATGPTDSGAASLYTQLRFQSFNPPEESQLRQQWLPQQTRGTQAGASLAIIGGMRGRGGSSSPPHLDLGAELGSEPLPALDILTAAGSHRSLSQLDPPPLRNQQAHSSSTRNVHGGINALPHQHQQHQQHSLPLQIAHHQNCRQQPQQRRRQEDQQGLQPDNSRAYQHPHPLHRHQQAHSSFSGSSYQQQQLLEQRNQALLDALNTSAWGSLLAGGRRNPRNTPVAAASVSLRRSYTTALLSSAAQHQQHQQHHQPLPPARKPSPRTARGDECAAGGGAGAPAVAPAAALTTDGGSQRLYQQLAQQLDEGAAGGSHELSSGGDGLAAVPIREPSVESGLPLPPTTLSPKTLTAAAAVTAPHARLGGVAATRGAAAAVTDGGNGGDKGGGGGGGSGTTLPPGLLAEVHTTATTATSASASPAARPRGLAERVTGVLQRAFHRRSVCSAYGGMETFSGDAASAAGISSGGLMATHASAYGSPAVTNAAGHSSSGGGGLVAAGGGAARVMMPPLMFGRRSSQAAGGGRSIRGPNDGGFGGGIKAAAGGVAAGAGGRAAGAFRSADGRMGLLGGSSIGSAGGAGVNTSLACGSGMSAVVGGSSARLTQRQLPDGSPLLQSGGGAAGAIGASYLRDSSNEAFESFLTGPATTSGNMGPLAGHSRQMSPALGSSPAAVGSVYGVLPRMLQLASKVSAVSGGGAGKSHHPQALSHHHQQQQRTAAGRGNGAGRGAAQVPLDAPQSADTTQQPLLAALTTAAVEPRQQQQAGALRPPPRATDSSGGNSSRRLLPAAASGDTTNAAAAELLVAPALPPPALLATAPTSAGGSLWGLAGNSRAPRFISVSMGGGGANGLVGDGGLSTVPGAPAPAAPDARSPPQQAAAPAALRAHSAQPPHGFGAGTAAAASAVGVAAGFARPTAGAAAPDPSQLSSCCGTPPVSDQQSATQTWQVGPLRLVRDDIGGACYHWTFGELELGGCRGHPLFRT